MNWNDILPAAVTLFLVMDPIGNVPVFNAVLSKLDTERRAKVVARELLIALFILTSFLFAGNAILAFLKLSQSSLNISGGVLLFIISLRMIFPSKTDQIDNAEVEDPFIVPLAVPLTAGPSTIALLLLLSSSRPGQLADWTAALFLAWLCATAILIASSHLMRLIGTRGARALERLMGMILVILATQMFLDGLRVFLSSVVKD